MNGMLGRLSFTLSLLMTFSVSVTAQESEQQPEKTDELAAIRSGIESYVAAFNEKNVERVLGHWTEAGVYVDQTTGDTVTGQKALKESLETLFDSSLYLKLTVEIESIDLVSPSVALERGVSTVLHGDEPITTRYNAVHVKRGDRWQIDRISETEIIVPKSHYEQLKALEWMIGTWTDEDAEAVVTTECNWTRNQNFLIRSFTVTTTQGVEMAGMQVIGWDPSSKQIRSWTFDSDGGFSLGLWNKTDDTWSVQNVATLPDGGKASSTSLFSPLDENRFRWQQVNRVVSGELLPNLPKVVIQRSEE